MKTGVNSVIVLVLFLVLQQRVQACSAVINSESRADILSYCYAMLRGSSYGMDTSHIEVAAWIVHHEASLACRKWPSTNARNKQIWARPKPLSAVAIVHTHPAGLDPKPSRGDVRLAQKIRTEIYTVSRKGIWKVDADGHITSEAGEDWYRVFDDQIPELCR